MRETGLMISPFIIEFTYLFDLPTLFTYLTCQFCYLFPDFLCFLYPKRDTRISCLTMFYTFLWSQLVYRSQWEWLPRKLTCLSVCLQFWHVYVWHTVLLSFHGFTCKVDDSTMTMQVSIYKIIGIYYKYSKPVDLQLPMNEKLEAE